MADEARANAAVGADVAPGAEAGGLADPGPLLPLQHSGYNTLDHGGDPSPSRISLTWTSNKDRSSVTVSQTILSLAPK